MDAIPEFLARAIAQAELDRLADEQADRVIAAIRAIPDHTMCPELLAQIAAALSTKAGAMGPAAAEVAQGYLDDLHDDMRGFAA